MVAKHNHSPLRRAGRKLRVEVLEQRRLLDVGGWCGTVICDDNFDDTSDLFAVDLTSSSSIDAEFLGWTEELMFDLAFAPDGNLYGIGGLREGPSELYLIHVDFEDPGGEILTEYLGTVSDNTGDLWLNGLEFRDDGVLLASGFNDAGSHGVYSVSTEDAGAVEEVSLGFFQSAGDLVFDGDGDLYVTTLSSYLLKIDSGLTDFEVVGFSGVVDFFGLSYGPAPVMYGFTSHEEIYRIDPADATVTPLGVFGVNGLAKILGAATVFQPPTSLGSVDFIEMPDQEPILGELWYKVETAREGFFTVDLPDVDPGADVTVALYTQNEDTSLNLVTSADLRLDHLALDAGEEYFVRVKGADRAIEVRLTNLVTPTANGAVVYGTDEADRFDFVAGTTSTVIINGVAYDFDFDLDVNDPATVSFLGGLSDDVAVLTGSDQDDVAILAPGAGTMVGPGYAVDAQDTRTLSFHGGGGDDAAVLTGSASDDTATLEPLTAAISGPGLYLAAHDTDTITLHGGGGTDSAAITGSVDADVATLAPGVANVTGSGFLLDLSEFHTVAFDGGGGDDVASLTGSNDDDDATLAPAAAALESTQYLLSATATPAIDLDALGGDDAAEFDGSGDDEQIDVGPQLAQFSGSGFIIRASGFETVEAASGGGGDQAVFRDSDGNETLSTAPNFAFLKGDGFSMSATGFATFEAYGSSNGGDLAKFYDSPGDETFTGAPYSGLLAGDGFSNSVTGFDNVQCFASGGFDQAVLQDSPGDDHFVAVAGNSFGGFWYGDGSWVHTKGFDQVQAGASQSGFDQGKLYDSPGDDTFEATPDYAQISGNAFVGRADSFDRVNSFATAGGDDLAEFFDGAARDKFIGTSVDSMMGDVTGGAFAQVYFNRVKFFEQVIAHATDGDYDRANLYDSYGDDTFEAYPQSATLSAAGQAVTVNNFNGVHAFCWAGGNDVARLYGSADKDEFHGTPLEASLYNPTYFNRAVQFDEVYADAGEGDDDAFLFDSEPTIDLFEALGEWARLSSYAATDYLLEVESFDFVNATASTAGDWKDLPELTLLDFVLELDGPWEDLP